MVSTGTAAERLTSNRVVMWLAAALGGIVIHSLLWQVSEPPNLFCDFYKANWAAAETLWEYGLKAYWPLTEKGGFSNLPVVAWLYVPLIALGEIGGAWTWWALGVAALIGAWALLVRLARLSAPAAAGLLFLFIISGPVVNSLREGQSSHFILLFLVAGLVLWRGQRRYLAGLAFGFCALIKLPLLLIGIYFVMRQRWLIVAGGMTTIGVAAALSLVLFGLDGNIGWYQEWVVPYLNGYIPAFNVQSVDGFLMRWRVGEDFLRHWDPPIAPTLGHRIARYSAFAVLFGGLFLLMWRADRCAPAKSTDVTPGPRDLLEFVLVINLALIISPISWTHYYLWLFIPWALYLGGELPLPDDAITRALMRAGFTLVLVPVLMWSPTEFSWYAAILSRTAVSVWFFGGILMFLALARGLWHTKAAVSEPVRA
jgi:hypothetical protein